MRYIKFLSVALLSLAAQLAYAASADGAVGMVLDIQGSGQLKDGSSVSKLQLLSYLKPEMQVSLDTGSKASITIYATRTVYQLTGPAVVEVAKDKLNVLQGKPPTAKTMQEKLVVAAENVNVTPGAYRMRKIELIRIDSPANGDVLLDLRPTFRWTSVDSDTYDIVIEDGKEQQIVAAKAKTKSWDLPADVKFKAGAAYHWTVSYTDDAGTKHRASGDFSIATKEEFDTAMAEMKPTPAASTEEWIMYAAMLQNRGLDAEAQAVWKTIFQRRPDLRRLQGASR